MWELGLVAFGAVLGALLTFVTSYWMHRQQREDADRDWHRSNQRDIDWQAQDFVIEVQAFAFDPKIQRIHYGRDPLSRGDSVTSHQVFNRARAAELIAKANAFEARVVDPELKHHIQKLNTELLVASDRRSIDDQRRGSMHAHCQKFYDRIAKLYGGPVPETTEEQPPKLEYRAAPGPVQITPIPDTQERPPETSP